MVAPGRPVRPYETWFNSPMAFPEYITVGPMTRLTVPGPVLIGSRSMTLPKANISRGRHHYLCRAARDDWRTECCGIYSYQWTAPDYQNNLISNPVATINSSTSLPCGGVRYCRMYLT